MNLQGIIALISITCSIIGCLLVVLKGYAWAFLIVIVGLILSIVSFIA
ncbi:hypothetical protein DES51_111139 [Dielma fastidiosa]|uniref:Uncharacterized protein n=1 Tax=Dielma fastidiosa TaxID=1034346 RepID=A0A318L6T9_9FIRM|nr:hypothetical protein DES51_111139 [Dielma fastidiosa]